MGSQFSNSQFHDNVEAFDEWKSKIVKNLNSFRLWLKRNQLSNEENDARLFHLLETLKSEYLTIAFAGEFSRGKTELINAIFFADYGQRILPSQAGRTTMCPTELFYDKKQRRSYLRLLPIETRLQETSLNDYKSMPGHWVEVPLLTDSPLEMAQAMHTITQTKTVSIDEALSLGFEEDALEPAEDDPELVEIPAWRHAMVSFPHPLLQQGLCILDTPGLNALGSEPELTLSMLPQAQAVVFVLSADTGVTASDLEIWEEHIAQLKKRPNLGLYAVLNKIDTLWDDLTSRKKIEKAMNRVIKTTARHLEINENDVLPVSAQKGLLGKVREDKALLLKSQLPDLERILSETILGNKETLLWEGLVAEAQHLIEDSTRILESRRGQLINQQEELRGVKGETVDHIRHLVDASRQSQAEFKKRLLTLKPSQRLVERQAQILLDTISPKVLEEMVQVTLQELVGSKTTRGIFKNMRQFFDSIEGAMNELCREAELSNKMAESMYEKFQADFGVELLEPRLLPAKRFRRQLKDIIDEADQFNRNFLMTFTEQSVAVKRFFSTTVSNIMQFFKGVRKELIIWTQSIMNPLVQQVNSQKELIDNHFAELSAMQHNDATVEGRLKALNTLVLELEIELENGKNTLDKLSKLAPENRAQTNVVNFARARR